MCHKVRWRRCESRTYQDRSSIVCIFPAHLRTSYTAHCTSYTRLSSYRYRIYCYPWCSRGRRGQGFGGYIDRCSCPALGRGTWGHKRGRSLGSMSMWGTWHCISLYRKSCKHAESGSITGSFDRKSCTGHLPSSNRQHTLDNLCLLSCGKSHKNDYIRRNGDLFDQRRILLHTIPRIYHP
jgi:hypothetical protein